MVRPGFAYDERNVGVHVYRFKKKTLDFTEKMARDTLRITMEEDVQELDETVVVAFGQQKKESVVSAITTVRPMDLKSSSSDLTTQLRR